MNEVKKIKDEDEGYQQYKRQIAQLGEEYKLKNEPPFNLKKFIDSSKDPVLMRRIAIRDLFGHDREFMERITREEGWDPASLSPPVQGDEAD